VGLSGLGIPYVLPIGLWVLAAGSLVTLGQRMHAVHRSAAEQAKEPNERAGQAEPAAPAPASAAKE
jgi:CDP-diacylglycerol--glycerol-3-phosphate 3-phosphatidyltransferase